MSKNILHDETDQNESQYFLKPEGDCSIAIRGLQGGESVELAFAIEDPGSPGEAHASGWRVVKTYTADNDESFQLQRGFIVRAETKGLTDSVSSVTVAITTERIVK